MKFGYLEYVRIRPLDNLKGRIIEIRIKENIVYNVEYWLNGEQRTALVFEDELCMCLAD